MRAIVCLILTLLLVPVAWSQGVRRAQPAPRVPVPLKMDSELTPAAPASNQGAAASSSVLEVAVFRVAPVMTGPKDSRAKSLPAKTVSNAQKSTREIELRAQKNESWEELFQRVSEALGVKLPGGTAQHTQVKLPTLSPGKYLRATAGANGVLEIEYVVSPQEAHALRVTATALQVSPLAANPLLERMRADPAKASLFTATDAVGLPESIALQLTEIFAGEVDFLRELHQGYRCAIVYEAQYREGFIERSGRILLAELEIGNRQYRAYASPDSKGREMYFDLSGKSIQRLFRRSPLEFTRITSDFTLARFHPILGVWTAHRGVDYAAPTGTKVMAVSDGVVDYVGERGGYGNLIIVRHQEKFLTYYAHLNAYAPQLTVGKKVMQGDTIGFVGMTGLATGPHLHFEFHVRSASGAWESVPAPDVIDTTLVAAPGFLTRIQSYRRRLEAADHGNLLFLE